MARAILWPCSTTSAHGLALRMITSISPRYSGPTTPPTKSKPLKASPESGAIRGQVPGVARAATPVDASARPQITIPTSAQANRPQPAA
eukprot:7868817-Pyramimonas_sp.AAC.1